jgi:phosphogluconate dehydratase
MNPSVVRVTQRIVQRSQITRQAWLASVQSQRGSGRSQRAGMGCANMAHTFAALPANDKLAVRLGIVTAYNDMLSAHQPLAALPRMLIKAGRAQRWRHGAGRRRRAGDVRRRHPGHGRHGAVAVLARRDRDVHRRGAVAQRVRRGAVLGVCDKIVPGLLMGALQFGHLPAVFVPAGPMTSGLSNDQKARCASSTPPANSAARPCWKPKPGLPRPRHLHLLRHRQQQPDADGSDGPAPAGQRLRQPRHAAARGADGRGRAARVRAAQLAGATLGLGHIVDEKAIVNAIVGLLATGGSTNHTLHLVAIARAPAS